MKRKATPDVSNFSMIVELTERASTLAIEALAHAEAGRPNAAIGALIEVNQLLSDAGALGAAAIILYRRTALSR